MINNDDFAYHVRKGPGISLTKTESHFVDVFSSFRSGIENQLSVLGSKFKDLTIIPMQLRLII